MTILPPFFPPRWLVGKGIEEESNRNNNKCIFSNQALIMPRVKEKLWFWRCVCSYMFLLLSFLQQDVHPCHQQSRNRFPAQRWVGDSGALVARLVGGRYAVAQTWWEGPVYAQCFFNAQEWVLPCQFKKLALAKFEKTQPRESRRCLCTLQSRSALAGYGQL